MYTTLELKYHANNAMAEVWKFFSFTAVVGIVIWLFRLGLGVARIVDIVI